MPAYNFQGQFVEPIRSGKKCTTIRPCRKNPTRVGDVLHLFTGQRTSKCEKIGVYRCVRVRPMLMWPYYWNIKFTDEPDVNLSSDDLLKLVRGDGFKSVDDFFMFFAQTYGTGQLAMELIEWDPLPASPK